MCNGRPMIWSSTLQICWIGILLIHSPSQHYCFLQCLVPTRLKKKKKEWSISSNLLKRALIAIFPRSQTDTKHPISLSSSLSLQMSESLFDFSRIRINRTIPGTYQGSIIICHLNKYLSFKKIPQRKQESSKLYIFPIKSTEMGKESINVCTN